MVGVIVMHSYPPLHSLLFTFLSRTLHVLWHGQVLFNNIKQLFFFGFQMIRISKEKLIGHFFWNAIKNSTIYFKILNVLIKKNFTAFNFFLNEFYSKSYAHNLRARNLSWCFRSQIGLLTLIVIEQIKTACKPIRFKYLTIKYIVYLCIWANKLYRSSKRLQYWKKDCSCCCCCFIPEV